MRRANVASAVWLTYCLLYAARGAGACLRQDRHHRRSGRAEEDGTLAADDVHREEAAVGRAATLRQARHAEGRGGGGAGGTHTGTHTQPVRNARPHTQSVRSQFLAARGGSTWRQHVAAARGGSTWRQHVAAARRRSTSPQH
eukprot:5652957-Prymnesium_polylepis.1